MNKMRGVARQTRPTYGHLTEAWDGYRDWLVSLIRTTRPKRILEVGGGANPALSLEEVPALGVSEYTFLDVSERELAKTPSRYSRICADICSDDLPVTSNYDLVISRMLAEHVRYPRKFHKNIYHLLVPGGRAFYFLPNLPLPIFIADYVFS